MRRTLPKWPGGGSLPSDMPDRGRANTDWPAHSGHSDMPNRGRANTDWPAYGSGNAGPSHDHSMDPKADPKARPSTPVRKPAPRPAPQPAWPPSKPLPASILSRPGKPPRPCEMPEHRWGGYCPMCRKDVSRTRPQGGLLGLLTKLERAVYEVTGIWY